MEILREAVIFFVIVFLIVGGAVYLSDKAPAMFAAGERPNVSSAPEASQEPAPQRPLAKIFFKATLKISPPFSFSGRQVNDTLSLTYSGSEVPFSIGGAKIKGADGTHSLVLRNYAGELEVSRAGESRCRLNGKASEVSLDMFTFSEDAMPVSADAACSILVSDMAVLRGFSAQAREGSLNVTGNSALFSIASGDSIEIGEYKGSVQFNAVTNELVLAGFTYKVSIRKSDGSTINLS